MSKRLCDRLKYFKQLTFKTNKWILIEGEDLYSYLKDRPACYVIYNGINKNPIYVGHSNMPHTRFRQHFSDASKLPHKTPWLSSMEDLIIKIKYPSRYGYESMLEKRLIRRLKPVFNKYKLKIKEKSSWR